MVKVTDRRSKAKTRSKPEKTSGRPEAVRIRLLGGFRVSVGSRVVKEDAWRLKKAASLVKLLALAPNHRLHREQLMEALWPGLSPKAASNNLRGALHLARRILEPESTTASGCLRLRDAQVVLCPEESNLWVDVEAFEATAATATTSSAVAQTAMRTTSSPTTGAKTL
jgi:DNA-binding SARP family transcriptional activator